MLSREIYLVASGDGLKVGEFLIELNFDQPGILSTLSNIFAEHDVNIINIAIDSQRQHLHFVVDLSQISEEQVRDMSKQLGMFAFVRRVKYRISKGAVFVPRWIIHVIDNVPGVVIEKTLFGLQLSKLIDELSEKDAEIVRELAKSIDLTTLEEVLYIPQLRGFVTVEDVAVREGRVVAKFCNLAHPHVVRYIENYVAKLGFRPRVFEEGNCVKLEI